MKYAKRTLEILDGLCAKEGNAEPHRGHLGASGLGESCDRRVWLQWRWAFKEQFDGRTLRLFDRGNREEPVFLELLRKLGATVWSVDEYGKQFRIVFAHGHGGGSCDGVAVGGVMEIPEAEPYLIECKTHNNSSFKKLVDEGVMGSHYKHFVQAQLYMHGLNLKWCLYMAVNKDNDELHFEVIQYDEGVAWRYVSRAEGLVESNKVPPAIADKASHFVCRYCPGKVYCFEGSAPLRNCRTCISACPDSDGVWSCSLAKPQINTQPETGCGWYKRAF